MIAFVVAVASRCDVSVSLSDVIDCIAQLSATDDGRPI
jgi:hypothetical protein